jgi:hypothetical protein
MKLPFYLFLGIMVHTGVQAQETVQYMLPQEAGSASGTKYYPLPKLRQQNYGAIIGLQRGNSTAIELGAEMHWRKIGLKKPTIWGATTNLEYSFSENVIGYKAGVWRKQGRVNLTYGANLGYFTDFKGGHQVGIGPAVGFRVLGLHLVNGYNILLGNMSEPKDGGSPARANTLYMSLRYYFPLENKFVWDRKDKGKENRYGLLGLKKKEKKSLFGNRKQKEESKGLFGIRKKKQEEPRKGLFGKKRPVETPKEEPKGLRRLFKKE